ncbi:MAG: cytoskeletal protein CcmA (bactofilin family) [Gammaproteobacteria bacterium]
MNNKVRRAHDNILKTPSIISGGSFISGVIKSTAPVIVLGKVEGDCEIEDVLSIRESGEWLGTVRAQSVILNGTVKGNITTETKLEVGSTGKIQGNVTAGTLAIASGAVIDGEMIMVDEEEPVYFEEKRIKT